LVEPRFEAGIRAGQPDRLSLLGETIFFEFEHGAKVRCTLPEIVCLRQQNEALDTATENLE
jgi:hypothetical protein